MVLGGKGWDREEKKLSMSRARWKCTKNFGKVGELYWRKNFEHRERRMVEKKGDLWPLTTGIV